MSPMEASTLTVNLLGTGPKSSVELRTRKPKPLDHSTVAVAARIGESMHSDANSPYVDGGYLRQHPTWHDEDAAYKAGLVHALLTRNGLSPHRVCDVGCGSGAALEGLLGLCRDVTAADGYDISPQAIDLAKGRETARLRFHLGSMPPLGTSKADVVLCLDVVEHVSDEATFLRELCRTGDRFIFNVPLQLTSWSVFRSFPLLDARKVDAHVHFFTKDLFFLALEENGLRALDWLYHRPPLRCRGYRQAATNAVRRLAYRARPDFAVRMLGGWSLAVLATPALGSKNG